MVTVTWITVQYFNISFVVCPLHQAPGGDIEHVTHPNLKWTFQTDLRILTEVRETR